MMFERAQELINTDKPAALDILNKIGEQLIIYIPNLATTEFIVKTFKDFKKVFQ